MKKISITILTLFFALNLFSQDTNGMSESDIRMMSSIHSKLNEPLKYFPLIESDSLKVLTFESIKELTKEIEKELELVFVKYYSKSNVDWSSKDFRDYFIVQSKIRNNSGLHYGHINFEIDTSKIQNILNNKPIFEHSTSFISIDNQTTIGKRITPKKNDSINLFGKLPIKIKYLVSYDTIKLSRSDIGNKFNIGTEEYKLKNINKGKLYIQPLDASITTEKLESSSYITFENQNMVHFPNSKRFPTRRLFDITKTSSVLMNDSLVQLPTKEYENYLKNLKSSNNQLFTQLFILDTNVEFDKIYILIPKYDYLSSELNVRKELKNVDDIKIVEYSFPIEDVEIKSTPIKD